MDSFPYRGDHRVIRVFSSSLPCVESHFGADHEFAVELVCGHIITLAVATYGIQRFIARQATDRCNRIVINSRSQCAKLSVNNLHRVHSELERLCRANFVLDVGKIVGEMGERDL